MKIEIVIIALIICIVASALNLFKAVCGYPDCSQDDVLCAIYYDQMIRADQEMECLE